ncbi:hypothetical protein NG895_19595 [Aeoliella sp. ICT_H6.2]|uniref:Uncharacterized protein n=1 Tax=Aeoliella straminimaris TaxID=2954799 RepID=A0A9X2FC00_9BACT|nr:hypothetical protein [Aeoliella straminimaris]MCO6046110.1 hypothetical protein [Aeoliella straminimaris]
MPFNDPVIAATLWLLSLLWTWWIARSIQGQASIDRGQAVIQYGPRIRALALLIWTGAAALTLLALFEPLFPWWGRLWLIVSAVFVATVLHVEFHCFAVRYDPFGVHFISPWRADRLVPWDDFCRVYYSDLDDAYVLQSNSHGKMSLHKYLSGIDSLLGELAERGIPLDLDNSPSCPRLQ